MFVSFFETHTQKKDVLESFLKNYIKKDVMLCYVKNIYLVVIVIKKVKE